MIVLHPTEEFERCFAELSTPIQRKTERRLSLFRQHPFHPSLRTEKLQPRHREVWSFRIDQNYRIIFRFRDDRSVYLLTVGPHHWIYRYV